MKTPLESAWESWLTDDRLARWNELRARIGIGTIDREAGAEILVKADVLTRNEITARIT